MNPPPSQPFSPPTDLKNHVILCGLGNLGYRIMEQLLEAKMPVSLLVIDNAPEHRYAEELAQRNIPLLQRDSRAAAVLYEAGIEQARALITIQDDLRNLETTLEAKRINPHLRVIASHTNSQIAQLINKLPNCQSLSQATLTHDAFVNASMPYSVTHLFHIRDKRLDEEVAVVRDLPNQPGTISELYGRMVPLLVEKFAPDGTRTLNVSPPPRTAVETSDHVYMIGRVEDLINSEEVDLDQKEYERSQGYYTQPINQRDSLLRRLRRGRRVIRQFFNEMGPRFRNVIWVFLVVLVISALALLIMRGDTVASAIYFGLSLVIGQTPITATDPEALKLIGFVITLIGIVVISLVNAYITNYIITARLSQVFGQQKAIDMSGHVIIVGLGEVGNLVALELLERRERIVVIERDENNPYIERLRRKGVPVIQADGRLVESLELANVGKARCITILSNDDLGSLETALNARERHPNIRVVLRMFDRELAQKVEENFGIKTARSTSALAAPYFVASALGYEVITSFYVRNVPFVVSNLKIKPGSRLEGLSVRDLYTRSRILALALRPHPTEVKQHTKGPLPLAEEVVFQQIHLNFYLDPDTTRLDAGDTIYFVGPYQQISLVYDLNDTPARPAPFLSPAPKLLVRDETGK